MSEEKKKIKGSAKEAMKDVKGATKKVTGKAKEKVTELKKDAKEVLEEAKDATKKATSKAKSKASELKEDAKEAFEDLKEDAKEFTDEVKEEAKEISEDAKKALNDDKTIAIIAHLTIIGWVIALVMNNNNKTELGSFYIRQVLGIMLLALLSVIPLIGLLIGLFCFVLWVISLIGALGGNQKPVFALGEQFQEWFKSL